MYVCVIKRQIKIPDSQCFIQFLSVLFGDAFSVFNFSFKNKRFSELNRPNIIVQRLDIHLLKTVHWLQYL